MSNGKPGFILPAVVTAMLLGLYVGTYYAMVERYFGAGETIAVYSIAGSSSGLIHRFADPLFAPMNWLDRRLRPQVWDAPADDMMLQSLDIAVDPSSTVDIAPAVDTPSVEPPSASSDVPLVAEPTP